MKTFDEFYNGLQNEDNSELNELFKEAKAKKQKSKKVASTICLLIDIVLLIIFLIIVINTGNFTIFLLIPIIVFALITNVIVFSIVPIIVRDIKKRVQFSNMYKDVIIRKIISNFYDNSEYFPDKLMPEYIYKQLNYEYYDKYYSDDYFEALIDNKYGIQMAEIKTQEEETYEDSDGKKHTRNVTKFHGLFAKIVIDKSIKCQLSIMQNGKILFGKDKLNMDSSEFEKYFDVKTSDKIIGMQLLTADVMEDLIEFTNKTNIKYDVSIKDNEIYLRFHSGEMFEANHFKEIALDKDEMRKYFYMLNFTYNLSHKLINVINETQI